MGIADVSMFKCVLYGLVSYGPHKVECLYYTQL